MASENTQQTLNAQGQRIQWISLLILAFIGTSFAITYARDMLIPFVLAIFLSYIVLPLVDICEKRLKFPRPVALVSVIAMCLLVLAAIGLLLVSNVRGLVEQTQVYRENIVELTQSAAAIAEKFGMTIDQNSVITAVRKLPVFNIVGGLAGKIVDFGSSALLTGLFLMFLLTGQSKVERRGVYLEIDQKIRQYLLTKMITSGVTGTLTGIVLALLGVELAFLFGLIAFILNFIPTLGSIIATVAPIPFLLLNYSSLPVLVAAIAIPGLIQFVIGNIVEPRLMGESLDMHPATVMLALMFWGMLWGTVGMILSVPITATMKIVFQRIESTRAIAELMAGRLPTEEALG